MFSLIKFIIWIVGLTVVTGFALNYFGYAINRNYFNERKADCQERLNSCVKEYIRQGTENAKCDFNCLDPKLIIKKN